MIYNHKEGRSRAQPQWLCILVHVDAAAFGNKLSHQSAKSVKDAVYETRTAAFLIVLNTALWG